MNLALPMRTLVVCIALAGCGGAQPEATVMPVSVENDVVGEQEWADERRALEALTSVRRRAPEFAAWRPTSVVRLDETLAVLDASHAFVWLDEEWKHFAMPGPAPFGVGSMGRPDITVRGDGHRALFAGPSGDEAIGLFELTAAGVAPVGVLPSWVVAYRAFVASGTHLYVSVSDDAREREGTILHAERGAGPDDWQPLAFSSPSNTPDRDMLMTNEGAILLHSYEECDVLRLPSEGPSFEPVPLFVASGERSCSIRVSQGIAPERIVVLGVVITIYENGESRDVPWPEGCFPFERPSDYDDYDQLTETERQSRESDAMARQVSPGLVGLKPMLFERFHARGAGTRDGQGMSQPMTSAFHREEDGRWTALPEEDREQTDLLLAMHASALTRPTWGSPVNWGAFRIAVAQGRWLNDAPQPTLRAWRAEGPEVIVSAFEAHSRR